MKAGAVLVIAGAWVLSQVLAGNALGRLGVIGNTDSPVQTLLDNANRARKVPIVPNPMPGAPYIPNPFSWIG